MITYGNRKQMNFTQEENKAIAEELVEELREEKNGAIRDFAGILINLGYTAFTDFHYRDLYPIASETFRRAKEEGIEFYEFEGNGAKKVQCTPARRSFIINNEAARIKCPRCGGMDTARYIYGKAMPSEDKLTSYPDCIAARRLMDKVDSGKVVLREDEPETIWFNGARFQNSPGRVCRECGKRFARNPVYISPDGNLVADYRDAVEKISFRIENSSGNSREIVISKAENGASVTVWHFPAGQETGPYRITPDRWEKLVYRLYGWVDLQDWESEYMDSDVPCNEKWELTVTVTDGHTVEYSGYGACTPKWIDLIRALNSYARFGFRIQKHQKGTKGKVQGKAAS